MAQRVYTQTFGVVGAIIEKDGKILLVKESGKKRADAGKWNHPAGWLDVGENPIEGVKREVQEETGYEFMPDNILGVYCIVRKDLLRLQQEIHHALKIIYLGKISAEKVGELEDDVSEIKWFTPEEIYAMDKNILRDEDIKIMVKDYLAGKKYPLELLTHTIQK